MKFIYDADTDALYIDLKEGHVEESEEVAPGFVLVSTRRVTYWGST